MTEMISMINAAIGMVSDDVSKEEILSLLGGLSQMANETAEFMSALSSNRDNPEAVTYYLAKLGF